MKQPVERRLAAIFAADVAGYSRLMGAEEEGTLERLKTHRRELLDPKIKEHRGRIVKTTGDGILVEFPSVVDAVRCAVEIQRAMVDRNADGPKDKRITFRIGINLGDVIIDGDDIYGDGVNIAARLEALAEPSGICISRVVRDQIRDKLPYPFEDLGEQSVKNIARPVRVYAMGADAVSSTPLVAAPAQPGSAHRLISLRHIAIAAGLVAAIGIGIATWWSWPQGGTQANAVPAVNPQILPTIASTPAPRLSLVVLPFENLSRDPEQGYFADGITNDLTTDLSRIHDTFVIARNTAFTYKDKPVDAKQIGRELGVHYLIEGSVRRSDDQVQVNVQLIDTETGAHLWADRFDTGRGNLAEAQGEIAGRLARTLKIELFDAVSRRIEQDRIADPDARDLAMRVWARILRGPMSAGSGDENLQLAEQALKIDPELVQAKLAIAAIMDGRLTSGRSKSVEEDQARAERLLMEVLRQDPNDPSAHTSLGVLRQFQNRLGEARTELETAISLDRNIAIAFNALGSTLLWMGKPQEAIPYIEKAIRLNPHDPYTNYTSLGECNLLLGHLDQAIEFLRKARATNPRYSRTHLVLAGALALRGDLDEARAEVAEAIKLNAKVDSLAALHREFRWGNPEYWALREKTLNVGLRRAGFPEE
jgi:class 3 adenylate cyclase/TolB-like protein/Tfp pilus assembly protein PilF